MKKLVLLCTIALAVLLSSCNSSAVRLEYMIAEMQNECPCVLDDDIIITNIETDDRDPVIIVDIQLNDKYIYGASLIDALTETSLLSSLVKEMILDGIRSNNDHDVREFFNLVKQAEYNMVFRFGGVHTNSSYNITITPYEF